MRSDLFRDPTFRWISFLALVLSAVYVVVVGLSWQQYVATSRLRWTHGGATGLQAYLTALTALAVTYYLIETRRLRLVSERQHWPLVAFTLELERVEPHQQGPLLYARNLGGGPAVNVHIIGLSSSVPMIVPPQSLISALSSGGKTAVIQWAQGADQNAIRQDVGKMSLQVTCFEQTRVRRLGWLWKGLPGWAGQFTLQSFTADKRDNM